MLVYTLLLLLAAIQITNGGASIRVVRQVSDEDSEWEDFKKKFNPTYKDDKEEAMRREEYRKSKKLIEEHNKLHDQGQKTYRLKINDNADKTHEERIARNGFRPNPPRRSPRSATIPNKIYQIFPPPDGSSSNEYPYYQGGGDSGEVIYYGGNGLDSATTTTTTTTTEIPELPKSVDWRDKGYVSPIRNQGSCGSCYSFSASGSLEGQMKRKTNKLIPLSPQNIMDCSQNYGNDGCNGGSMTAAFQYVQYNGGIDSWKSYPYLGVVGTCKYKAANSAGNDSGFVDILPQGDEEALKIAVATVGPISAAIQADLQSFSFYSSGVYSEPNCTAANIDHGILVIGYGTDKKLGDYWIIKNSWGTWWGMDGFGYIARNHNNMCGIAQFASYPIVVV